tara:strand:+ start:127 stop:732 length:606 start_codon:yes stop_codon:yes gene_type:complete
METIKNIAELENLYGRPGEAAVLKVTSLLTPAYQKWIERSRFCVLSTVAEEGTDGSPRGDDGPVVQVLDAKTLALPDWRGNQRIDSLRNIVRDGRVSLMFMVAGSNNVIRVNGTAELSADPSITERFEQRDKHPKIVILITIKEVYSQCARSLMRAGFWSEGDQSEGLPSVGEIMTEISEGEFDGDAYDESWLERAKKTMW